MLSAERIKLIEEMTQDYWQSRLPDPFVTDAFEKGSGIGKVLSSFVDRQTRTALTSLRSKRELGPEARANTGNRWATSGSSSTAGPIR